MKMHITSRIKVCSLTTYPILLVVFKELLVELLALKLNMGFEQQLAHLSPSWLLNTTTSLTQHLAKQGFKTWYKLTTMWETSWGLSH